MNNFIYKFLLPCAVSYMLTYLTSLLLLSKVSVLVSKPKPELEGFHGKKESIPNIGGLSFVVSSVVTTLIFATVNAQLIYTISAILCFAVLGFVDDFYKKDSDNGDGIKSTTKLFWQFLIAIVFVIYGTKNNFIASGLPFLMKDTLPSQIAENSLLIFLLVYFVNAFNITDGLDGLAGYVSLPLCVVLILVALVLPDNNAVLILSVSILSAVLAFLKFNKYPAKYFMGDCGSMALGATLLLIAFTMHIAIIFIVASFMISIELVTSLIQILAIRIFKKRVFTIAPIHHMYEKRGESEVNIVSQFARISALFSIVALLLFYYWNI